MTLLEKAEKKLGRYAIPHIMRYFIIAKAAVYLIGLVVPQVYGLLYLTPELITEKHQFWRLISFLILPEYESFYDILWMVIYIYFYYFISEMLESNWGAFRFNVFLLIGYLFAVIGCFLFKTAASDYILLETIFLAFATLFPDIRFYVFFIIPVRSMWLGIISGIMIVLEIGLALSAHDWSYALYLLLCMGNYILFFAPRLFELIRSGNRKTQYQTKIREAMPYRSPSGGKVLGDTPFHRCCVCGITDLDDPSMTFRYCSSCAGNYEYCSNHLHNHEHKQ